jgi:diguanylate cyclase (GGDEF)-like protein
LAESDVAKETQAAPDVDNDVVEAIKKLRRPKYGPNPEVIDRVKEYEKAELTVAPGGARDGMDRLALLDPMTELYNFRTFLKELKAELNRAQRYKQACSLCLLTVDSFDEVVQERGYLTGDAVLRVVANVLRITLRDSDVPAKYAPQVFAVIFPQTGPAAAAMAAERLRNRIGNQAISHNWQTFSVTASVGVASYPAQAESYDQLIARAIEALEFALERGGDRVFSA